MYIYSFFFGQGGRFTTFIMVFFFLILVFTQIGGTWWLAMWSFSLGNSTSFNETQNEIAGFINNAKDEVEKYQKCVATHHSLTNLILVTHIIGLSPRLHGLLGIH